MPFNFPSSPSLNQIYTANNASYMWDGSSWKSSVAANVYSISIQVEVDFGSIEVDSAYVTVNTTAVTQNSTLVCTPSGLTTTDHDPDDYWVEQIMAYPINIINNVSFDVIATAPNCTWGKYKINVIGRNI